MTHSTHKKTLLAAALGLSAYVYQKRAWRTLIKPSLMALPLVLLSASPAMAQMNEQLVNTYTNAVQSAANAQNISQLARLISDDVVISLNRQGKGSATLDKSAYLDLLQKSWTQTSNYRYTTHADNIVITGDTARVSFVSKETWTKDGQSFTLTTTSKSTLGLVGTTPVLLRSVAQVSVD